MVKIRKKEGSKRCLRCENKFKSKGRFNRLCPNCAKANRKVFLPSYTVNPIGGEYYGR